MPKDFAAVLGLILLVISAIHLVINLYEWRRDMNLLHTGTETTGIITDAATYPDIENVNSGQYRFYADFTVKGVTCCASSRFASRKKSAFMNREVAIVYDPENPARSRFKHDISVLRDGVEYIILFIVGLALSIYGIFF
ncbi:MAG: hypothetical protein JW838_14180 [Spirochaetes bacterium]|nr:hypothetical protein [Spirochaetota bacterium]